MAKYLKISAILFLTYIVTSCTKNYDHVELISDFWSYESICDVEDRLIINNYEWTVTEDVKLKDDDPRPPYHMYGIVIQNYSDLDVRGRLKLGFFNDRLFEITFYPNDINLYLSKLLLVRNINLQYNKKRYSKLRLKVYKNKDFEDNLYIRFSNRKIERELSRWIRKYS